MLATYSATQEDFMLRCVQLQHVGTNPFGDIIHAVRQALLQLLSCRRTAVTADLRVISLDVRFLTMTLDYVRQIDGAEQENDWPQYRSLRHVLDVCQT
jgi:hypothetical protein